MLAPFDEKPQSFWEWLCEVGWMVGVGFLMLTALAWLRWLFGG